MVKINIQNKTIKIVLSFITGIISTRTIAKTYDNHYINYVYDNYLKSKKVKNTDNSIDIIKAHNAKIYNKEVERLDKESEYLKARQKKIDELSSNLKNKKTSNKEEIDEHNKVYATFGMGLSNLFTYQIEKNPKIIKNQYADMKNPSSNWIDSISLGYGYQNINAEIEYTHVKNDNLYTEDINNDYLLRYGNNLKINSIGVNVLYSPNLSILENTTPFIGIGYGKSSVFLSDYGIGYFKDGLSVDKTTPGNEIKKFDSDEESTSTTYIRLKLGAKYSLAEKLKLIVTINYNMINNAEYEYLKLKNIDSVDAIFGLRYSFN